MKTLIIIIVIIIIKCVIIRKIVSNYIMNINESVIFKENVNYLYDDHFENSDKKSTKDLVGNFSIIRYNFMDNIYYSDIKTLKLNNVKNILNLSLTNCNFDIYIANQNKNITIYSLISNLIDYKTCKDKINSLNLSNRIKIHYGKYNDINNIFKDIKFDRIVLLESIGKIKKRKEFLENTKQLLLNKDSFIYIKTLVFRDFIIDNSLGNNIKNDIFEKQKYMIDFWNYNFSTNQAIINDSYKSGLKNVKMKSISMIALFFTYNLEDIINVLRLYFVDLDLGIKNIPEWLVFFTMNVSVFILK
jgi:hypothetical protein